MDFNILLIWEDEHTQIDNTCEFNPNSACNPNSAYVHGFLKKQRISTGFLRFLRNSRSSGVTQKPQKTRGHTPLFQKTDGLTWTYVVFLRKVWTCAVLSEKGWTYVLLDSAVSPLLMNIFQSRH